MNLTAELRETVSQKYILQKWNGKPLHQIDYKDYKIIQHFKLYAHFEFDYRFVEKAVHRWDQPFLEWLYGSHHKAFNDDLVMWAASCGRTELVDWLLERMPKQGQNLPNIALAYSAKYGHLTLVRKIFPSATDYNPALENAAKNRHLHVLEWFLEKIPPQDWSAQIMTIAASTGNLDSVEWLHENVPNTCSYLAMDLAAGYGHLDIMEWFYRNCDHEHSFTLLSLLIATRKGYLDIVKWLYKYFPEFKSHLDLVEMVSKEFGQLHIASWASSVNSSE